MSRTLDQVIASLPARRRRKVETRAKELIAEEASLRDLRKAMVRTQAAVARRLRVGQDSVSRIETRTDMLLSTLRSYVGALGGELHLVATLPGRAAVKLSGLGMITSSDATREPKVVSKRASRKRA